MASAKLPTLQFCAINQEFPHTVHQRVDNVGEFRIDYITDEILIVLKSPGTGVHTRDNKRFPADAIGRFFNVENTVTHNIKFNNDEAGVKMMILVSQALNTYYTEHPCSKFHEVGLPLYNETLNNLDVPHHYKRSVENVTGVVSYFHPPEIKIGTLVSDRKNPTDNLALVFRGWGDTENPSSHKFTLTKAGWTGETLHILPNGLLG